MGRSAKAVDKLRNSDKADVVVILSHGGVNTADVTEGEDYDLAVHVNNVDVIVRRQQRRAGFHLVDKSAFICPALRAYAKRTTPGELMFRRWLTASLRSGRTAGPPRSRRGVVSLLRTVVCRSYPAAKLRAGNAYCATPLFAHSLR